MHACLKVLRNRYGETQEDFSRRLGVGLRTLRHCTSTTPPDSTAPCKSRFCPNPKAELCWTYKHLWLGGFSIVTTVTPSAMELKLNGNRATTSDFSLTQTLFTDLLRSSVILTEDSEKLPQQTQEEIRRCSEIPELLSLLVQHGLLTEYQAARVEAGKTDGLVLGNYRVLERLGTGGMGVVFKAEHVDMRRPVAIKVLSISADQNSQIQQRFRTEIRVVAKLQHPNIAAAMDAGTASFPDCPT